MSPSCSLRTTTSTSASSFRSSTPPSSSSSNSKDWMEELEMSILMQRLRLLRSQRELAAIKCQRFTDMLEAALSAPAGETRKEQVAALQSAAAATATVSSSSSSSLRSSSSLSRQTRGRREGRTLRHYRRRAASLPSDT